MIRFLQAAILFAVLTLGLAAPASAQLTLTGAGSSGASGPTAFDTFRGVYMPFDTYVGIDTTPGGTDTKQFTASVWYNCNTTQQAFSGCNLGYLFVSLPYTGCEDALATPTNAAGICWSFDGHPQFNLNDSDVNGLTAHGIDFIGDSTKNTINSYGWHHILLSVDATTCAWAIYIDNVLRGSSNGSATTYATARCNNITPYVWSNTNGFKIGNGGQSANNNSWWFSTIQVDNTSILSGTTPGTIDASVRQKFIDNATLKAVDAGAGCATAWGHTPLVCMKGDGSAWATNQGSLPNAFSQLISYSGINSSTRYSYGYGVQRAAWGPSGMVAGTPAVRWLPQTNPAAAMGATSFTTAPTSQGMPISIGDWIFLWVEGSNSSTTPSFGYACPSDGQSWSSIISAADAQGDTQTMLCWRQAIAADQVDATHTGASYVATWTTKPIRQGGWSLFVVSQASAVISKGSLVSTTCTNIKTPVGTITNAGASQLSLFENWQANAATFTPPASDFVNYVVPKQTGSYPQMLITQQDNMAAGAAVQKTTTMSASNFCGIGLAVELVP